MSANSKAQDTITQGLSPPPRDGAVRTARRLVGCRDLSPMDREGMS
jgi:hypothetical protein